MAPPYQIILLFALPGIGGLSDDVAIETLHTDYLRWLKNTEFTSDYEYERGETVDRELARNGVIQEVKVTAHGSYHKMGSKRRYSREYDGSVDILDHRQGGGSAVTRVDFDEVTNGDTDISYTPLQRASRSNTRFFDSAEIRTTKPESRKRGGVGLQSRFAISPLMPWSAENIDPFAMMDLGGGKITRGFDATTSGVRVTLVQDGESITERRELIFEPRGTAVALTELEASMEQAGASSQYYTTLDDFVDCPGGPVARRVVYVQGSRLADGTQTPYTVSVWRSQNLGSRPPRHEDFVITIPESTRVIGLADRPLTGSIRKLDVDSYDAGQIILNEPNTAPSRRVPLYFVVLVNVVHAPHGRHSACRATRPTGNPTVIGGERDGLKADVHTASNARVVDTCRPVSRVVDHRSRNDQSLESIATRGL